MHEIPRLISMLEKRILESGKEIKYTVSSSSMLPFINVNDKISIKKFSTYKIGDIVVFRRDKEKIVHRIVKINQSDNKLYYITKGDFLFCYDFPIHNDQILHA